MVRVYGKVSGRGHYVYIKTVYADEIQRLHEQGDIMYTSVNIYTDLRYEIVT